MKAQVQYSKRISNLISYCFGAFILLNLAEKIFPIEKAWIDILIVLPAIVGLTLAPIGLYFAFKRYRTKDATLSDMRRQLITFALISLIGFGILMLVWLKA